MIRGLHDGRPISSLIEKIGRGRGSGRTGVPPLRLEKDGRLYADSLQLLAYDRLMSLTCDDYRPLTSSVREAQNGLLKAGQISDKGSELLGKVAPRNGPQAGSFATAKDDGGHIHRYATAGISVAPLAPY
jgi:hypothetical protein